MFFSGLLVEEDEISLPLVMAAGAGAFILSTFLFLALFFTLQLLSGESRSHPHSALLHLESGVQSAGIIITLRNGEYL